MTNMPSTESNSLSSDFVEFMNEGVCKESFTAVLDFFKEIEEEERRKDTTRLSLFFRTLDKCIEAHSDYYQPIQPLLEAKNTIKNQMNEEWEAAMLAKMRDFSDKGDAENRVKLWKQYPEFMKRGSCKKSYMDFQDCMTKNKKDYGKCVEFKSKLAKCMYAHSDYYPMLSMETIN